MTDFWLEPLLPRDAVVSQVPIIAFVFVLNIDAAVFLFFFFHWNVPLRLSVNLARHLFHPTPHSPSPNLSLSTTFEATLLKARDAENV